jgi:hypothetical protein
MLIDRLRMRSSDLLPRIALARASARQALFVLFLFVAWLSITWLGPALTPPGGFSLLATVAGIVAYSVLTCVALPAMAGEAVGILRSRELRRVVSQHATPFWIVASLAAIVGTAVVRSVTAPTLGAVCLGVGVAFAILVAAFAWARIVEASRLERDRRHLAFADPYGPVTLF